MSETQIKSPNERVVNENIVYSLDLEQKTASVAINNLAEGDIFIPRSIIYKSNEYFVTSISENSFRLSQIRSIQFPRDSKIRTINKLVFPQTLETFSMPSSLIELKEGWCLGAVNLTKIIISPDNPMYKTYDDKMIIGKSSIESADFDSIEFCIHDIQSVTIPSFIKHIKPYVFNGFQNLQTVEIPTNSELQTIGKFSFARASIERFTIPLNLIKICDHAFIGCSKLQNIEIHPDSHLQSIGKLAFAHTLIESLTIPSTLVDLEEEWSLRTSHLSKVFVSQDNPRYKSYEDKLIIGKSIADSDGYDDLVFCARDAEKVEIPNFIKNIKSDAFNSCGKLQEIVIPQDSELQTIGKYVFIGIPIQSLSIPLHLTQINKGAFQECKQLERIEIPTNSELQIINSGAFFESSIQSLTIPPHLTKICEEAFSLCENFRTIEIPNNSILQTIEKDAFYKTLIESFLIPSSLIDLQKGWCNGTANLTKIKISPENPRYKLYDDKMIIGKSSIDSDEYDVLLFCARDVENVVIPHFIKRIESFAFESCKAIQKVEIPFNSKLQTIEKKAFKESSIRCISFPPNALELQTIEEDAFYGSLIENISIPSSFIDLKEGWLRRAPELNRIDVSPENPMYKSYDNKMVIGKSNLDSDVFDVLVFCSRPAVKVKIPSFIKHIGSFAFEECYNLVQVEIPTNSELQTIGKNAFAFSSIESFAIPLHLTKICKCAFANCSRLRRVEVPNNSELQIIEFKAFIHSSISSFIVPSHITQIDDSTFYVEELQIIVFEENVDVNNIHYSAFFFKGKTIILIPVKIANSRSSLSTKAWS